jgi:regulator of sigma E protease
LNAVFAALILFGIIILVHELGHFIVAKLSGIVVHEFSIGIGPLIWSSEKNGTLYAIRLFPIGGYNLIEGEDDQSDKPGAFSSKSVFVRFCVLVAGSVGNLLLGYLVLVILTVINGYVGTTTVAAFDADSISAQSIKLGDEILKVNGRTVRTSNDITYEILAGCRWLHKSYDFEI